LGCPRATSAAATEKRDPFFVIEEIDGVIAQELTKLAIENPDNRPEPRQPGYLELIVDGSGRVRRKKRAEVVEFDPQSAEWHAFLLAYTAGEAGSTDEKWSKDYRNDPTGEPRRKAKHRANSKLARLGIRFVHGQLKLEELPKTLVTRPRVS
jgi:hypothetical protein